MGQFNNLKDMDLDESITVTKINTQNGRCYMLIGWQPKSFEMYLYTKEELWKGRFSANRLAGFSKNLNMSEDEYYTNAKRCLSQKNDDCLFELKSGFFYWKRKYKDSVVMEGFLPMELDSSSPGSRPDLFEVILILNKFLKAKVDDLRHQFKTLKDEYYKSLSDTEEFLNLKIEMEKSLCDKFLNLLKLKKSKIEALHKVEIDADAVADNSKSIRKKVNKMSCNAS